MKNYVKPVADVINLAPAETIAQQPGVNSGNGSDADF